MQKLNRLLFFGAILTVLLSLGFCKSDPKEPPTDPPTPNDTTIVFPDDPADTTTFPEPTTNPKYRPRKDYPTWVEPRIKRMASGERQMHIQPTQVRQMSGGLNTAAQLVDGQTNTPFFPGFNSDLYPATVQIDLTKVTSVTKLRLWDGTGQPYVTIRGSLIEETPVNPASEIATVRLTGYQEWKEVRIDQALRFLYISLNTSEGDKTLGEVEVWVTDGTVDPPTDPEDPTDPKPACDTAGIVAWYLSTVGGGSDPDPVDTVVTPPVIGANTGDAQKINLCGFHWVDEEKMKPFSMKRDFQMAGWTWYPNGLAVQPLGGAMSPNVTGYDDYYTRMKAAGIEIIPCINETPEWFWTGQMALSAPQDPRDWPTYNPKESLQPRAAKRSAMAASHHPKHPPIKDGKNRLDPASYEEYARFMFWWAGRYGRKKVSDDLVKVDATPPYPNAPVRTKKSGLDLLNYIEPWNEPDAWWLEKPTYWEPEEFTAFLSAVYDGHNGLLGPGVGIKTADPTMVVVMPGLTGADLNYFKRMVAWCKTNRVGGSLPWDVTNFHFYSNTTNQAGRWPPTWTAAAPADMDPAWPDVEVFVKYAKTLNRPVWLTEMGADSRGTSWQEARPYGTRNGLQAQADFLVRNYLVSIATGIDHIFMFNAMNEPGAVNGGLYQNSGLLTGLGETPPFAPKPAYTAVVELIQKLQGLTFKADRSIQGVKILEFSGNGKSGFYAWFSTVQGQSGPAKVGGKTVNLTETPQWFPAN